MIQVRPESLDDATLAELRALIYDYSGINIAPSKDALVRARLTKRMRALYISDFKEYLAYVQSGNDDELTALIDAISTNVTSFYREANHFEILADHLTTLIEKGQKKIRIWCAAASSGEEPYTLALTAQKVLAGRNDIDFKILATDISTQVLEKARRGVYPSKILANVPAGLRSQNFSRVGAEFQVRPELRKMVAFHRLNLADNPYPIRGPFDAIFCRNVMIYFDSNVRTRVIREVERLMAPNGIFVIGHSESLLGVSNNLKSRASSVFTKA